MYRGSTPTLTFTIDSNIELDKITDCFITLKSKIGNKEISFAKDDVIIDAEKSEITLEMSQDNTLYFNPGQIEVQLRIKTEDERTYVSDIKELTMKRILKDGAI